MTVLKYNGIGITAMAGAVPKRIVNNLQYTDYFPQDVVKKVVAKVGVLERRFADMATCSSDLCFAAAQKLFLDNNVDRKDVDLLVFISQTPDYRMPATSVTLQHRLGLKSTCIAFDINLGCSAFLYGLSVVYGLMQSGTIKKALLLDGETRSKVYGPRDRRSAFIFGDAGIASLIECNEKFGTSCISLNSDGSRANLIMIKSGGYRHMSSIESLQERVVDEYGNMRSDEQGYMKGDDVFNFVIEEIPKDIRNVLSEVNMSIKEIDYVVFHQANNFINSYLARKMKLDPQKVPHTIEKFGNTSSVSVPLTVISELKDKLNGEKKLLMSAFGVGLTWASGIIPFVNTRISDLVEVCDGEPCDETLRRDYSPIEKDI